MTLGSSFERSKTMEVPYEKEREEELIGVDLQTRRRRSQSHHSNKSYSSTSSDNSTITNELGDSSFEYSVSMDTTDVSNNTIITNGENPNIIEGRSAIEEDAFEALSQADEEEPNKRVNNDINLAQNGDSNGFTVKQNGDGVVEETDTESDISVFSKIPKTAVGLRYVESLLDESSHVVNAMLSEIYNTDNIVNKTQIIHSQDEIVETGHTQELEPEAEEFEVERVIQNQESSNGVNGKPSETYNTENIVNKTQIIHSQEEIVETGQTQELEPEAEEFDVERVIQNQESSSGVNATPPERYNTENIVNKTLIINSPEEIVETGQTQELEQEAEEFDVEKVIQNQETHDFFCPNCHSCITKRVILKRRKRKIQEISIDEALGSKTGQLTPVDPDEVPEIDEINLENELSQNNERAPDARLDAISCFSCFSIFVPKGDGFLCWRFKPKPAVVLQPGDASAQPTDPMEPEIDGGRGTVFPLWILTCCQPYHTEKPVPKPGPRPPPTSDDGTEVPPHERELPLPPSHDTPVPHTAQPPIKTDPELPPSTGPVEDISLQPAPLPPVTPEGEKDFPLWFLTCCQPSTDRHKPEHSPKPGAEVLIDETKSPSTPSDDLPVPPTQSLAVLESVPKPLTAINPVPKPLTAINPADEGAEIKLLLEPQVPATFDEGLGVQPLEGKHASPPSRDTANMLLKTTQSFKTPTYDADTLEPAEQKALVTPEGVGTGFPVWFLTCCQPSMDKSRLKPLEKPDETVTLPESNPPTTYEDGTGVIYQQREPPVAPSSGTVIPHHDWELPAAPSDDTPVPPMLQPLIKTEPGKLSSPKPITPINPGDDILSPPEPEAPGTPPQGDVIVPFPDAPKLQPLVTLHDPSGSGPSPDVILAISDEPMPQQSFTHPDASGSGPSLGIKQTLLTRSQELSRPGVSGLDIIKAIVYGGLLECITSLSVISSAAGGDATTLNIVALGLANVFGGFVVLLHSLRELKYEHVIERYEEQLGRPGHYLLHAVVAILSYLVFGLLAPVIYGFTFRKSDNKDYKLATLAAASLACITILSIGKAYVRRPPKSYLKTVSYYVMIGFMVSGVGYVAGDLINMLLKKLGVFDSTAPVTMPLLVPGAVKGAWSSY